MLNYLDDVERKEVGAALEAHTRPHGASLERLILLVRRARSSRDLYRVFEEAAYLVDPKSLEPRTEHGPSPRQVARRAAAHLWNHLPAAVAPSLVAETVLNWPSFAEHLAAREARNLHTLPDLGVIASNLGSATRWFAGRVRALDGEEKPS